MIVTEETPSPPVSSRLDSRAPGSTPPEACCDTDALPRYLTEVYRWAYLNRLGTLVFDQQWVVSMILWGNANRLIHMACDAIPRGTRALQNAAVYGSLSKRLAEHLGADGSLEVNDIAPIQVALTRRKLRGFAQATVDRADATIAREPIYGAVLSFFLLHELPDPEKRAAVSAALHSVGRGGRAVFIDYHEPSRWNPLRPVTALIFHLLEPFAKAMWSQPISGMAEPALASGFSWEKQTVFGGLYQRVVATRRV